MVIAQPSASIAALAQPKFAPHLDAIFLCTVTLLRSHLANLSRPCQPSLRSIAATIHELIFSEAARCTKALSMIKQSGCASTRDCVHTILSSMYLCNSPVQTDLDAMWRSYACTGVLKPEAVRYVSGALRGRQLSLRKRWEEAIESSN